MTEEFKILSDFILRYGYLVVFIGSIISGDAIILVGSFLAFLGFFNIFGIAGVALAGLVISDNLWFLLGHRFQPTMKNGFKKFYPTWLKRSLSFVRGRFNTAPDRYLVLSKFVYGMRIAVLLLAGEQRLAYPRFFSFNFLGSFLWLLVPVTVGYLISRSWGYLEGYKYGPVFIALLFIAVIVVRYLLQKTINYFSNESGNRTN